MSRTAVGTGFAALMLLLAACGGPAPTPGETTAPSSAPSSAPPSSVPTPSSTASTGTTPKPSSTPTAVQPPENRVEVDITIADDQVSPNGDKIDVPLGATVVLKVTSDIDDEIHAHTGGDGYELEVTAGKTATGTFTAKDPGSFEVESHHLEKIIVILNVR